MSLTGFNRYRNRRREQAKRTVKTEPEPKPAEPVHIGGGWYEVDGKNYRGREAAEQAAENQE